MVMSPRWPPFEYRYIMANDTSYNVLCRCIPSKETSMDVLFILKKSL